jgi:predicted deacylase
VAKEIDPRRLQGTLILVPVANPMAFYAGARRTPADLGDLNRSFPGAPDGTMSERLANFLFTEFVLGNDFVLSMHCFGHTTTTVPYVEYPDEPTALGRKAFAAAMALGLEYAHPYTWHPGLLGSQAMRSGIPAIEPEVGGIGTITSGGQQAYRQIVYALLTHLKMLPADPAHQAESEHTSMIVDHTDVLANFAGLFRTDIRLGQRVEKNELLGFVHDLAGAPLQELRAPKAGIVAIQRTFASVQPGDRLFQLFWEKPSGRKPKGIV